jgi:mannonate dehydratase
MLLKRQGAERDYGAGELEAADAAYRRMDDSAREQLIRNVVAGLPGANEAGLTLDTLRVALEPWTDVSPARLLDNLSQFLRAILPTCESHGIRMCIHPDDPPRPLLGLPRIASTVDDFRRLFSAVTSPVNGITLCAGSLASRLHGDPLSIAREFASRVHFAHLRNVHVESDGSFTETAHLEGDIDVVDLTKIFVSEERRRESMGESPATIAMRPDHGAALDGDIDVMPGYPWLGRLKGLAELRGVMYAVERML